MDIWEFLTEEAKKEEEYERRSAELTARAEDALRRLRELIESIEEELKAGVIPARFLEK